MCSVAFLPLVDYSSEAGLIAEVVVLLRLIDLLLQLVWVDEMHALHRSHGNHRDQTFVLRRGEVSTAEILCASEA